MKRPALRLASVALLAQGTLARPLVAACHEGGRVSGHIEWCGSGDSTGRVLASPQIADPIRVYRVLRLSRHARVLPSPPCAHAVR